MIATRIRSSEAPPAVQLPGRLFERAALPATIRAGLPGVESREGCAKRAFLLFWRNPEKHFEAGSGLVDRLAARKGVGDKIGTIIRT